MKNERILVVGPAWVGDMVMAQSLFKLLQQRGSGARIDVVAPGWSAPLVARMAEVCEAHVLPLTHGELGLATRRRLGHALRRRRYTRAIVLPRSFKAALVPWHARVPVRTGYQGELRYFVLNDRRVLDKERLLTTVSRYVALGLPREAELPTVLPEPRLKIDPDRVETLCSQLDLDRSRPVVAMLPGAEYGPAKQWPAAHFAELASVFAQAGVACWVFGSASEKPLGEEICATTNATNLCGRTELVDVIDLLSCARVAVSNDSGLMHVAAASGCAVVAIYGSSSPAFTPPLTRRAKIMIEPQPCSPCFARTCRFDHYRCLTDIRVSAVQEAVLALLNAPMTA